MTLAGARPAAFDSIVADEIHVRKKLVVGDAFEDGVKKTAITLQIADLPDDQGRAAFLSLIQKTGDLMTLSNPGKRPEISVMDFEPGETGNLKVYNSKWEPRQR
jgi:hypothetical protein